MSTYIMTDICGSLRPGLLYVLHQGVRQDDPVHRGFPGAWHRGAARPPGESA